MTLFLLYELHRRLDVQLFAHGRSYSYEQYIILFLLKNILDNSNLLMYTYFHKYSNDTKGIKGDCLLVLVLVKQRRCVSPNPFRGEKNDEYSKHSTMDCTNFTRSGICNGWLPEGHAANREASYKHGICEGLCALDRSCNRCLRNIGGNRTYSPGCNGHLALVNAGRGDWFSLDDGGSDDYPWAAWGVSQYGDQRGAAAIGPVCGIWAFCGCPALGVEQFSIVRWVFATSPNWMRGKPPCLGQSRSLLLRV